MDRWAEHVFPHSDVNEVAPGLWQVTGRLPHGNLPRNMVVYRLPKTGGLLIHSGIALDDQRVKQLEALGRPEILIVPNRFHRLDAAVYKGRYPEMQVVCPHAARAYVEQKVKVDAVCEELLPDLGIRVHTPSGMKPGELCYELPVAGGRALIVTDTLFNLPHQKGVDGFLFRILGSTGFFGLTNIGRLLMLKDKKAFKEWLVRLSALPDLKAVCVGHGNPIAQDVSEQLKAAAARL